RRKAHFAVIPLINGQKNTWRRDALHWRSLPRGARRLCSTSHHGPDWGRRHGHQQHRRSQLWALLSSLPLLTLLRTPHS
ncbi:hypothetical protein BD289DRAFT_506208, partial [Coniella lustricola]